MPIHPCFDTKRVKQILQPNIEVQFIKLKTSVLLTLKLRNQLGDSARSLNTVAGNFMFVFFLPILLFSLLCNPTIFWEVHLP